MTVAKDEKLDWLPPGWKVEEKLENGRKVRHYVNAKSAKRLHSKAAVLQYMKSARMKSHSPQLMNGLGRESPKNDIVPEPNDSLEWLPPGWTVEVRIRKSGPKAGGTYRCYIDPSTGKILYSKPEVLRYLKEMQHSTPSIVSTSPMGCGKSDPGQEASQGAKSSEAQSLILGSPSQIGHDKSDPGREASQQPKAREAKSLILRSAGPVKHDNSDPGQEVLPLPKSREARSLILGSARPVRHDKSDPGQEVSQEPKSCEAKSLIPRSAGPMRHGNSGPGQKGLQLPKSREARSLTLGSTSLTRHGVSDPGQEVSQEPKPREVKNLRSTGPIRHDNSDPGKKMPQLPKSREARSLILDSANPIRHDKSDPGQESLQESKSREAKSLILRSAGPIRHDNTGPVQDQPEPPKSRELRSLIKGSAGTIRQNKSDPGQEVSQSPRSHEVRSPSHASEVPARHDRSDPGQKVEQPPKSREARSLVLGSASPVRHEKSDPGQEVLQEPNSCEANSLTPSPANPIKPDNPDPGQKVPQHPNSREGKSKPTKKKKVMVETVIDQGLPPGWIKEIRIKKSGSGVRRDPFYLNPATGYVFRSRVEVLRYLETGEISRHAYRRRDSGDNGLHSAEDIVSPSASDVKSVAEEATTNRRLFTGEGNGEGSSGPSDSKARRSGVLTRRSVLPASGKEAKQNEEITAQISSISAHNEDIVDMNKQALPEACDIDGSHNKDVPAEPHPASMDLKNELAGSERPKDTAKSGNRKQKRKRKERAVPRRSSKRIAGAEVAPVTSLVPVERVTRSASKKSEISEAKQSESSQETPPLVNVGSQEEIFTASAHSKDQATREALRRIFGDEPANESKWSNVETQSAEPPPRKEDSSRAESPKDQTANIEDQTVEAPSVQLPREKSPLTAEQTGSEISKRQKQHQDSQFSFPWSDPCIEFAFKTLTGALQLDDNLAINDYVQHQIRTSADTSKNIILSDEGPPGFCQTSAPNTSKKQQQPTVSAVSRTQQFQPTDASSLKKNTFSLQSSSYFALSDEGPPGFCQNNAPSVVPCSQPTVAALQKTNIYSSQSRSYNQQHQMHTSSSKSVALSDAPPPGFSLSGGPPHFDAPKQQTPSKSAVPHPQPSQPNTFTSQIRDYTQYQVQSHSAALLDGGPPGFCHTNVSIQQQPTIPSVPRTQSSQWTNPALQKTDIFSPPNHSYSQHQIHTSLGSSTRISLSDERPPGFSQSNTPLQFDAPRQHQPANSFSPRNLNNFQHQTTTSSDGNSSIALLDAGPPGFRHDNLPLPTHSSLPQTQVSQPTGNIFNPQSHIYVQHQVHPSGVALPDISPPGFSQHDLRLQVGTSSQQQASNSVGPHAQQSQPASSMFGPRSHN